MRLLWKWLWTVIGGLAAISSLYDMGEAVFTRRPYTLSWHEYAWLEMAVFLVAVRVVGRPWVASR